MSYYEYLVNQKIDCETMAKKLKDKSLKQFYKNAAEGFQNKIENISIEDAEGEVHDYLWY